MASISSLTPLREAIDGNPASQKTGAAAAPAPAPAPSTAPAASKIIGAPNAKTATGRAASRFERTIAALQQQTGFQKTNNVTYFFLTAVVFGVFCLTELPALNYQRWGLSTVPGDWFHFHDGFYGAGMRAHLCCVIPAGIFMPIQFLPIVRRKAIGYHQWAGRIITTLLVFANITALMVAPVAFGGTLATEVGVIWLAITTLYSIYRAWTGIRNLHIDEHRKYMIRAWGYVGAILSMRLVLTIIAVVLTIWLPKAYKATISCEKLEWTYLDLKQNVSSIAVRYPSCANLSPEMASETYVAVAAHMRQAQYPEQVAAALGVSFGPALWIAIVLHVLITEQYLKHTREEDERLKSVSASRRRAAGYESAATPNKAIK